MGYYGSLRWHEPSRSFDAGAGVQTPFDVYGVPRMGEGLTPVEEARQLLMAAAEVEHTLMVQYLYAAYSASNTIPEALGAIINVAIEEMGHFITVQNLLLLIGGDPHLDRADDPAGRPGAEPFPFFLEPLSTRSLAKYLLAEMPAEGVLAQGSEDAKAVDDALRELSGGASVLRVGLIYSTISWMFQAADSGGDPDLVPDAAVFPAGRHLAEEDFVAATQLQLRQTTADDWGAGPDLVPSVTSRAEALAAIRQIASQGEGIGHTSQSHFGVFAALYRKARGAAGVGVDASPADVADPVALEWMRYLDIRYTMLLADIRHGLWLPADDAMRQTIFQDWAIANEMRYAIGQLGPRIMKMPKAAGSPRFAGPAFRRVAEFPDSAEGMWALHRQLTEQAEATARGVDPGGADPFLTACRQFDQARLIDVIEPALKGRS